MKSLGWLGMLLTAGWALSWAPCQAVAQDPDWYDDACKGCGFKAKWSLPPAPANCAYAPCSSAAQTACTGLQNDQDISVGVVGQTVTVRVWNYLITENTKQVFIRVTGTGATPNQAPNGIAVTGEPSSAVETRTQTAATDGAGNWSVEIEAVIVPQPNRDVLVFQVPGLNAISDVSEVWAWSCCTVRSEFPAVSHWGMAAMTLLVLASLTIVAMRRRAAAA